MKFLALIAIALLFAAPAVAAQGGSTTTTTTTTTPIPPYNFSVSPDSLNASLGSQVTTTLKATWVQAGITINGSFTASGVPQGVSLNFSPASGPMPLTSTVTMQVSVNTVPGQYVIVFTSQVGYLQQTASMLLDVGQRGSTIGTPNAPLIDLVYEANTPATFRMSYQYSTDVKISVKPLAQSNYLYKVGPTNATIDMPGSDNYVIDISVGYPQVVSQNLSWSIAGGSPPGLPSGANSFPVVTNNIVMVIHVSTVEQAHIPSPTDVANALLGLMQSQLQNFNNQYQSLVNQDDQNFETIYVFMGVVMAAVLALFAYVLRIARPRTSQYELKSEQETGS